MPRKANRTNHARCRYRNNKSMLEDVQGTHRSNQGDGQGGIANGNVSVSVILFSFAHQRNSSPQAVCVCVHRTADIVSESHPMRQTCCCPHLHTRFQMQLHLQDAPLSQGIHHCAVRPAQSAATIIYGVYPFYRPTVNVEGMWATGENKRGGVASERNQKGKIERQDCDHTHITQAAYLCVGV